MIPKISIHTVCSRLQNPEDDFCVIDVRTPMEWEEVSLGDDPRITYIPMDTVEQMLHEIPTDKEVFVLCRSGQRSAMVTGFLREMEYDAFNVYEGIIAL